MSEEQPDLFADLLPKPPLRDVDRLHQALPTALHLGTTSWNNEDWEGLIYPQGGSAQDYLEHYARTFHAVEGRLTPFRRAIESGVLQDRGGRARASAREFG
jgi:hypothetical protein